MLASVKRDYLDGTTVEYIVQGRLIEAAQNFYENRIRMGREDSDQFSVQVSLRKKRMCNASMAV